jgi:uncharacterized protein (DUF1501 family)
MKRRDFLHMLAAAPLAAAAPAWATPAGGRLLVLVYLHGGNDGYNTWVPYTDRLYYRLRPNIAVPRDSVLKVTDRHGFHPSLAPLVPLLGKDLAVLQGIGLPEITQQHYRDTEMAFTASDLDEYLTEGWVTRALSRRKLDAEAIADAMAFDVLDIRESDPMGPFRGGKQRIVQVHYAHELLAKRRISQCVIDTNAPGGARLASGGDEIPPIALRTQFPEEPFGQAARAAVELAAFDRSLPVIHIALNGLDGDKHHSVDCHWDQLKYHGDALRRLAEGLVALRTGLMEIGRWNETLVATYDEFGRSPVENERQGTHHGCATTHFILGGRVKAGVHGEPAPVIDVHQVGGPLPTTDSRSLWTTVVERWWATSATGMFARPYSALDLLRA